MTPLKIPKDTVRLEGLHDEPSQFPFATLAASMDEEGRDFFAKHVNRTPMWTEGGREEALKVAARVERGKNPDRWQLKNPKGDT